VIESRAVKYESFNAADNFKVRTFQETALQLALVSRASSREHISARFRAVQVYVERPRLARGCRPVNQF